MSTVRLNYLLDSVIAAAFLLSGTTGIAFLIMGSGGYQGGRNAAFGSALLGISRSTWSDLHTFTSIVMIVGVAVHLTIHWRWIVGASKKLLQPKGRRSQTADARPSP